MEQKTIIILGGGTGGLVASHELKKKTKELARIMVIDKNDMHIYAPSFLWLMLGQRQAHKIQKPLSSLNRKGIEFINDEVVKIEPERKLVRTKNANFHYDYLIIALGAELAPEKVPGLTEAGYDLYELEGVERLREDLKNFAGGKVAIIIASLPFKCPAAPYEAAFLLDEYFQKKDIRAKTEISIFTPEALPMPAAGPENGRILRALLESRNIKFNPEVRLLTVDPNKKELLFEGNKTAQFDFLIFVPSHQGPKVIRESGLGNESGWIPVDAKTLKTKYDNVFALGDVAVIILSSGKPLSKAGVFAHYEAEVVSENIAAEVRNAVADKKYNGRAYCFLELGYGRAGFAGGNFYAEPVPVVRMKRPGRVWHLGKVLFEKYWLWKWF
ncbi:MAG: Sulfide-quinone reductase [candidate division WS2 bacterium]|nr:Sulfide-quinone reductase [Candidatus Lithacetigena glycinireducens]